MTRFLAWLGQVVESCRYAVRADAQPKPEVERQILLDAKLALLRRAECDKAADSFIRRSRGP